MASITAEGMILVDLVDVYLWLHQRGVKPEPGYGLRFCIENDSLQLVRDGEVETEIDAAELWWWIRENQIAEGLRGWELVFGVPTFTGNEMSVTYAAGNDSDPRTWKTRPGCLDEWKST